jgi:pyruvate,water dikinase
MVRKELFKKQTRLLPSPMIGFVPEGLDFNFYGNSHDAKSSLKGVSGLKKIVVGKVHIGLPQYLDDDYILVLPTGHFSDIIHILGYVKGIIFEGGAPYDHLGIIAREMDIPTLYYVHGVSNVLKTGDNIKLDGVNGEILVL